MSETSDRRNSCPNKENHTNGPDMYLDWHVWAEKMSKTHKQVNCSGCGLWAIWVPKEGGDDA